jgi:hypothetical protein
MFYRLSADLIVIVHLGFVIFVLLGGILVLRWPRLAWLHLLAVGWGASVEFRGWICPLTPLENWLRTQGGEATYTGDFLVRYLSAILYPEALTHELQVVFGTAVVVVNLMVYGWVWRARRSRETEGT